jgi:hypothetical protein
LEDWEDWKAGKPEAGSRKRGRESRIPNPESRKTKVIGRPFQKLMWSFTPSFQPSSLPTFQLLASKKKAATQIRGDGFKD